MLQKIFTPKNAIKVLLSLLTLVIILHLLILGKIIPYEIAWGGRLQNDQEMYVFESISIFLNLMLCFVLLMKGGYIPSLLPVGVVNGVLWFFFAVFLLNTIGNLFSSTNIEKSFSLLTLLFAVLIWRILRSKE